MPRSRNIKPALFKNELLGDADPIYTLLFAGLWCLADKEGRLEDRPKRIKAEIFPYRFELDSNKALDWLNHNSFIKRYSVDGENYIQITKWKKHQSPHHKEVESTIPKCGEELKMITNQCDSHAQAKHGSSMDQAQRKESASTPLIPDSLNSDSLNLVTNKPTVELKPDGVSEVFEFWQETFNHKKAVLDDKRKRFIKKALKLYSIDDCKRAITGCSNTPHNMGENDRKQKYNGIHIIFKDADQIERFIGNAEIKRKSFGAGAL